MDAEKEGLANYNETFLECRNLRHAWKITGYFRKDGNINRVLACIRCGTEGTDIWRPTGERVRRKYAYLEQYKIEHGRALKSIDFRKEVIHRATIFENEEQMMASLFNVKPSRREQRRAGRK